MANAQQTIFNVPTPDVLERGKIYVELDASPEQISNFVPRVVF